MPSKTNEGDLFQLAHAGYPDKLSVFLQKNVNKLNVNEFAKDGATALIQCVQGSRVDPPARGTNHVECCRLLLRHGAKANLADKLGRTALHWAVFYKKAEFISVLLEADGDVTKEDKKGQNLVQFAIRMNAADCLKLICGKIDKSINSKILIKPSSSVGTPLIQATKLGHKECCEILLQAGANIDIQDQTYFDKTSLHIAAELNNVEILEMLIKFDANVDAVDSQGNSILHQACAHASPRCLEAILREGGKKKVKRAQGLVGRGNKAGLTPLMVACQLGYEKHVEGLLEHKSPVATQDESGKTALHHATEGGHRGCAKLLLGADSGLPWTGDSEGRTPLHLAVIEGKRELVELLVGQSGLNAQDSQGHTPIHWAVVCGFHDLIDILVDHGGDPSLVDDHGASPLHYAAQMCGDPSVSEIGLLCLKALIRRGAKVNAIDVGHKTPLLWAASAGSSEACKLLKEAGADVTLADLDGLTALHCAVTCNHSPCVDTLLLECGCGVDTPDKNGCTPLFYASSLDQVDNVRVLLEKGASPSHTDNKGKSPMHCAAAAGSLDALRLLQENKGSMETAGIEGETPFHDALEKGDLDTIKFMVANGCKLDCRDDSNRTPLHIAATNGNVELCRYLVEQKVDPDAMYNSKNGLRRLTSLDCAWDAGAVACMDYLASIGAQRGRDIDDPSENGPPLIAMPTTHPSPSPRPQDSKLKSEAAKNSSTHPSKPQDKGSMPKQSASSKKVVPKSEKSPYMAAPRPVYDRAEERNREEQEDTEQRKSLRSSSVDKKLADWEGYIKDHVGFLDHLLGVDHERLKSIQTHAVKEKEDLVKKLNEIRGEMEKRMETKASEEEKLKEERRKQQAKEKKIMDDRWKKIQEQYSQLENKASQQLMVHRQSTQVMDSKEEKNEKRRKKREMALSAQLSRRPRSRASTLDDARTQNHVDWLKKKNKEYLEKKNAVKLKGVIKVDSTSVNAHFTRGSSPRRQRSPVPSRVDHSHSRRSPSPPHDRLRYQRQELEKQQRALQQQHQQQYGRHRSGVRGGSRTPNNEGRGAPSPSSGSGDGVHGNRSSPSPHPPGSTSSTHQRKQEQQRWSSEDGEGGREGGRHPRPPPPSGPDAVVPPSRALAQLRRSHGDNLNRKLWPKSWELQEERARGESEQEEIFDLKKHFTPRWDGKLRPRHVLQFKSPTSGLSSHGGTETQAEA